MATPSLTMEARLIDFVSKNLEKIGLNIRSFAKEGKDHLDKLKEAPESLNKSFEGLERTLKGRGGIAGFAAKFAGLNLLFKGVEESLDKVFESAMKGSPELEKGVESVKGKINQLYTEIAQKLTPVFIMLTDFILQNWDKIRFVVNLVYAGIKDLFNLMVLGLQTITLGFKGFILGVTGILNKLGIVSDKTFSGMAKDTEAYGEKVAEAADKLKIFGNVRDAVSKGVAGQGKAPKANIDIFNKNEKKDAEELAAFRVSLAKQNETLIGELSKEGMAKDLALSKAKYDNLNKDLITNKNYVKLSQKEKYEALAAIDNAGTQDQLNITKKYLDEELKYRHKIQNNIAALKAGSINEGPNNENKADKDLALSKQKFDQMKIDMLDDKMFAILTTQEKNDAINAIETASSAERQKILEEEHKRRLEQAAHVVDNISKSYDVAGKAVMAFAFDSSDAVQKSADKQTKAVDKQLSRGLITQEGAEAAKQKILDRAAKKNRERAIAEKDIALVMAVINTAQAVTAALAHYDYIGAVLAGVVGATQITTIEAQGFKDGGLIPGKNTPIITNEDGRPEFVLNADTVSRVGVDNLNAMNNGASFGGGGGNTYITNENHFAPSATFNGNSDNQKQSFQNFFDSNAKEFFEWFEEKKKKGYGKKG